MVSTSEHMRLYPKQIAIAAIVVAAVLAACSASRSGAPADGLLALGTWGGDTAGVIVGDTAVHVHVACTYGDVSGRIQLDAGGRFDVAGSYLLRAYPIAVGPTMPARFVGRVDGSVATLTVAVNDTIEKKVVVRGPITVKLGEAPRLGPCPICSRPVYTGKTNRAM